MSYNVLTIRTGGEPGDAALYPLLSDLSQPGLIALESQDGPNVVSIVATAVRVMSAGESLKTVVRLRDVRIDVYITDGRLALACEKYDKGGGWVGFGGAGVLIAVTANAVSKARAASRSRGKVLVGHIRYPWIKAVGASSKSGFGTEEAIRIEFCEKASGATLHKLIELTLPKNIDATLVAQDIARRVAAYRLTHAADMAAEVQATFAHLGQSAPRLQPQPRTFAYYQMPTYYPVSASTAYPVSASTAFPGSAGAVSATRPAGPRGQHARPDDSTAQQVSSSPSPARPSRHGSASVFCTRCGTRNAAGDNFCGQCGSPLKRLAGNSPINDASAS